ncbi:hypothetical protein K435DRAFT_796202 [Dendrothele bispora CBS 962.96]|uniref:Uncharacterized protein n=1 Tax=Dendrothele bispora (strain CBS 962.96) TaxID=1314807 RepID=A0A4S8M6R9_DENBC|nr:hypothetical protein K435DRAFT_796202 [Dendrothele bispora CBS 962.96]
MTGIVKSNTLAPSKLVTLEKKKRTLDSENSDILCVELHSQLGELPRVKDRVSARIRISQIEVPAPFLHPLTNVPTVSKQAVAEELESGYTSLSSSGTSSRIWIPVVILVLCGLVALFRKRYPCLVPSTLEIAVIDLDNAFSKYRDEGVVSSSTEIEGDVKELKIRCSRIKTSSLSGSHSGVPHRDRIRWRKKLLMEIIECYEDIQTTRNEIEEAREWKKQQLYTLEISCRNNAFESRTVKNRGKDKNA